MVKITWGFYISRYIYARRQSVKLTWRNGVPSEKNLGFRESTIMRSK